MEPPDETDLEASEVSPIRGRKVPFEPRNAEPDDHELLHEPDRDWCRACVAGRRRSDAHVVRNKSKQNCGYNNFAPRSSISALG